MWWIVLPVKTFAFTDMFVFKIDTFANEIMGLSCYGRKSTPLWKVGKSAVILFHQLYELIEASSFQAGQAHSGFRCNLSALPRCVHLLPILWRADSWPPKLLPFGLGCRNAFRLALFDGQPLLLGNGPHHLNQDRTNLTYSGGSLQMRQSVSEHSYMLRGIRFSTAMQSMETVTPLSYPIFTHSVDMVLTADSFHRILLYGLTGSPPGGSI